MTFVNNGGLGRLAVRNLRRKRNHRNRGGGVERRHLGSDLIIHSALTSCAVVFDKNLSRRAVIFFAADNFLNAD